MIVLIAIGAVIVALGIALAPFILPALGWLLGLAAILAALVLVARGSVSALVALDRLVSGPMGAPFRLLGRVVGSAYSGAQHAFTPSLAPADRLMAVKYVGPLLAYAYWLVWMASLGAIVCVGFLLPYWLGHQPPG